MLFMVLLLLPSALLGLIKLLPLQLQGPCSLQQPALPAFACNTDWEAGTTVPHLLPQR
jgi:hypothetical protein